MKHLKRFFYSSDRTIFHFINDKIKCKSLDIIMLYITKLGGAAFTLVIPLLLIIFGKGRARLIGVEWLVSLVISHIVVRAIKRLVTRERPFNILKNINTFDINLKDYSFPSGHTTAIFSIITVLSINLPFLKYFFVALAVIIGISRIYLGVHYPSDVIVGIIIGSMTSVVVHPYFINYLA